jgi:MOSC domain-containing protein YiiM
MNLISLNVGRPRDVRSNGRTVRTSFFKSPVASRVAVRRLNVDGDEQADLSVHGGIFKAVYAYPSEHYEFWRGQLPGVDLPWGSFGENLTTEGVLEDALFSGDRLAIGSASFVVTQPRMPCFKLGIRFGDPGMVARFLESGRPGFYLAVEHEGEIAAGDEVTIVSRWRPSVSVHDLSKMYAGDDDDGDRLRTAGELPSLSPGWRARFRKRLDGAEV